jgi:hypothetical protein
VEKSTHSETMSAAAGLGAPFTARKSEIGGRSSGVPGIFFGKTSSDGAAPSRAYFKTFKLRNEVGPDVDHGWFRPARGATRRKRFARNVRACHLPPSHAK